MKYILIIVCLLLLVPAANAQMRLFSADADTAWMISDGAGELESEWVEYDDFRAFEGGMGLWHAVYSNLDGMSVDITLSYKTRSGVDDKGGNRETAYATVSTLTTTEDTSVEYGTGDQVGVSLSLSAEITNFAPHTAIKFKWSWTTSGSDTAQIHAALIPVEPF